jgi:hypothetical protein
VVYTLKTERSDNGEQLKKVGVACSVWNCGGRMNYMWLEIDMLYLYLLSPQLHSLYGLLVVCEFMGNRTRFTSTAYVLRSHHMQNFQGLFPHMLISTW